MTQKAGRLLCMFLGVIVWGWYHVLYLDDRVFFIHPDFQIKRVEYDLIFSKSLE
jgi:hypothetical protein